MFTINIARQAIATTVLGLVFVSQALSDCQGALRESASAESGSQPAQQSTQPKVLLREGTEVNLKLAQKLTSKTSFVGEPVELVVAEDLKVGDDVVVQRGTRVLGAVVEGKESEKKHRPARELAIRVDYVKATGAKIGLRGGAAAEGKRNKKAMAIGGAVLGVSGILLTSGKRYVLPEGSPLKAYVDKDVEVPVISDGPPVQH